MEKNFSYFKSLHELPEPLVIANVWNVQSARVFEKAGFKALATSSAAVAETLGYADGEQMSFEEYYFVINRIARSVNLPLSVDLESGYGDTDEDVVRNIQQLATIGVVGINIEDSVVKNRKRSLVDAQEFADRLQKICDGLNASDIQMFVNVRCDSFLLGLTSPVEESKRRLSLYEKTGVHGLFFPCITAIADIQAILQSTTLPVNVMCMPHLPEFAALKQAGVKRISMGNSVNQHVYRELAKVGKKIMQHGNFTSLF